MRDYRKIKAWQLADDLVVNVYKTTRSFPKDEVYGLTSQIRRAAYSVPANIAEGASRSTAKDYLHFLYIARGSCSETQYFLHLARRLDYLDSQTYDAVIVTANENAQTLYGLIKAVESEVGKIRSTLAKVTSFIAYAAFGLLSFRLS